MNDDILGKHRRAEKRENPHAFDNWLTQNCRYAIPPEKLRKLSESKKETINRAIDDDD